MPDSQPFGSSESPANEVLLVGSGADANLYGDGSSCRGISFGTAGALKITTRAGQDVVIPSGALAAGIIHPIMAKKIWLTGTTAALIVAYR